MTKFILKHNRMPGDILMVTALTRDIKRAYPDIELAVNTPSKELWRHNPYVGELPNAVGAKTIHLDYRAGLKRQKEETVHFLSWMHRDFEKKTGLHVPVTEPKPDVHLIAEELIPPIQGRYWVLFAGGKSDAPIKVWSRQYYQQVVDELIRRGIRCVQVGKAEKGHWHHSLNNVLDLRGKTSLRDVMKIVNAADGVICGITMGMHMAAALERPCVCIAGGREAWWWEAYVNENTGFGPIASGKIKVPHRYLHTIGLLPCCQNHGCWRNKVVQINNDPSVCKLPVQIAEQPLPKCLAMITPEHVIEAVMSYYEDRTLPPITPKDSDASEPLKLTSRLVLMDNTLLPASQPEAKPIKRGITPAGVEPHPPTDILDHPIIGGKFTVFILMYGGVEFFDMHRECLSTILGTIPAHRRDLRIASNQLNPKSLELIDTYIAAGEVRKHYLHPTNDFKYPVMREMFHDASCPIETNYLLWFDDDTVCDKDPMWLPRLGQLIVDKHPSGYRLFGPKYLYRIHDKLAAWYRESTWYKGRAWRDRTGKAAPNGAYSHFATGSFWALNTDLIKIADIPDARLAHNGGDYTIGEQVWQAGYDIASFSERKLFVSWSKYSRRGVTTPHPGT
jgi:ADP-heptose:LPS heptosyltransferase